MRLLIVNRLKSDLEIERGAQQKFSFITFSTVSYNSIKIKLAT